MTTRKTKKRLTRLVIGLAVLTGPASYAQTSAPESAEGGLSEVVVTAQKREQRMQDVPISMSVASADELQQRSIINLGQLPSVAPALVFQAGAQPAFTTLSIRGVGSYVFRIGVQPAVSVVVDGIPMARTSETQGQLGDIAQVEVLSGPQGTLFGRNATGGAINITRNLPGRDFEVTANDTVTYGRLGSWENFIKGSLNVPINDNVRFRIYAFDDQNTGYIKNLFPTQPDAGTHDANGVQAKLAVDFSSSFTAVLSGDFTHDFSRNGDPVILLPLQQGQQPNVPNISARETALQGGSVGQHFAINDYDPYLSITKIGGGTLDLTWNAAEHLSVKSLSSYRDNSILFSSTSSPTAATPDNPQNFPLVGGFTSTLNATGWPKETLWHYYTEELRMQANASIFDIVTGIYYFNLHETETTELPGFTSAESRGPSFVAQVGTPTGPTASFPYYYSNTYTHAADQNTVTAGFLDVTAHPMDGLDVFAGYRLSRESLDYQYARLSYANLPVQYGVNFDPVTLSPLTAPTSGSFNGEHSETDWAGRFGGSYELVPSTRVYATVSRGYVGAGVDLGNASRGSASNPGSALLRPSISKNFEIGLKSELFEHRLRADVAIFKQRTDDVQITALIPGTTLNVVQNAGDIDAKGVELNMQWEPLRPLELSWGFSYLDAVIQNLSQLCYPGQTVAQGCVSGSQNVSGKQALNAPKFKTNLAATYTIALPSAPVDLFVRADYAWQSSEFFQLNHDPLATQGDFGIGNVAFGLVSKSGRYQGRFFINNVADTFYCLNMVAGAVARQSCQSPLITAQRQFGLSGEVKF
jgi:iron complex outermembrane recepter protein